MTDVQRVVVTGTRTPSDDVTVIINDQQLGGWQTVRITRGIERCPSDFALTLTEKYPASVDAMQIKPGDECEVLIGLDRVLVGYVDATNPRISPSDHSIRVSGRSRCQDLVDCSAEWPGGQITGSSVLEIASKLAAPFDITVSAISPVGDPLPIYQLSQGETPFEIIEKLCRYRQLLAYDDVDGNLVLAQVSKTLAASGFQEGVNVEEAEAAFSMHQRYRTYISYAMSVESFNDAGDIDYKTATVTDEAVKRHRVRKVVCPVSGPLGEAFATDRLIWELARRSGRSYAVSLTTDSWRDAAGKLYAPNTQVRLQLPTLKLPDVTWTISEVTYRKAPDEGGGGTRCDLVMMPPQAFLPEPDLTFQIAAELLGQVPAP